MTLKIKKTHLNEIFEEAKVEKKIFVYDGVDINLFCEKPLVV